MAETLALGIVFVAGTILLAFASYFAMRFFGVPRASAETKDLANSVMLRVSALHGLILALVFAQELINYQELRSSVLSEATAVADIYNDIRRYDAGSAVQDEVQKALSDYVRLAAGEEWKALGETGKLLPRAWVLRETVYLAILDLEPSDHRQESLRSHMLSSVQFIAEMRQKRENMASNEIIALFWVAAVVGVVLVTMPYFVFAPTTLHLTLLAIYGAFTGIVMLFIYAFSDPFSPPGQLAPVAFERLLQTEIGAK
jgi:hypothetical protein